MARATLPGSAADPRDVRNGATRCDRVPAGLSRKPAWNMSTPQPRRRTHVPGDKPRSDSSQDDAAARLA